MFDFVGKILLEKLVQIHLNFLPGAGFHPVEVQVFALLSVEHTALHQF